MAFTYIVAIIRLRTAWLMSQTVLKFGIVTRSLRAAHLWMRQKLSLLIMRTGNSVSQVWIIDPIILALLLDVIKKGNIPLKNVTGFQRYAGRWFIRVKHIGWLRTSDVLQMCIQINPQQEEAK